MIYYTLTDESPAYASVSLLPILQSFLSRSKIEIATADISLTARILAAFNLAPNTLDLLGKEVLKPEANILKLPNISATLFQLNAAVSECVQAGFKVPRYEEASEIYKGVLGSAVNPVLREGNSIRRLSPSVKNALKNEPNSNLAVKPQSKTRVVSMTNGDFYENERSLVAREDGVGQIAFNGKVLKEFAVKKGDVVSASTLSLKALDEFVKSAFEEAAKEDLAFGLHLKATMMKASDPLIFSRFVRGYLGGEFEGETSGLSEVLAKGGEAAKAALKEAKSRVRLAAVKKGVSCLNAPNYFIIDASVPSVLKNGGETIDENGVLSPTLIVIPDRTYASIYHATLENIRRNGVLARACGSVENIGLMAQKAEEYGSHDKTFSPSEEGEFCVTLYSKSGEEAGQKLSFGVQKGDIFRAFCATNEAVQNWISLAKAAHAEGKNVIFWLDEKRAHDQNLAKIVKTKFENAQILNYQEATEASFEAIRRGENVTSVTGNILRDYLTDLFPILEVGTSSKMLSIVPLLGGGELFETGAGGTAPVLIDTLFEQNHFAWDSLGEFLALTQSLQKAGEKRLSHALDAAVESYLQSPVSPVFYNDASEARQSLRDTRVSHFCIALFWARELSGEAEFKPLFEALQSSKERILAEFSNFKQTPCRPPKTRYLLDLDAACGIMRPSQTFNEILQNFSQNHF